MPELFKLAEQFQRLGIGKRLLVLHLAAHDDIAHGKLISRWRPTGHG